MNTAAYKLPGMPSSGPTVPKFWNRVRAAAKFATGAGLWAVTGNTAGQWEGHEQDRRRHRPKPLLSSQDESLNLGVREGQMAEARALCQTFGICRRILKAYSDYVVGTCRIKFQTEDEAWNDDMNDRWVSWMAMADVTGRHHYRQHVKMQVARQLVDGDIFIDEVRDAGYLQLDAIEADRVGNIYGTGYNIDTEQMVGGVMVDTRGRPVSYRVSDRGRFGTFRNPRDIPANRIQHVYDPERFDAYRGITHFHTALNDLRDIKQNIADEKLAQHITARIALLVKNAQGGPPNGGVNFFNSTTDENDNTIYTEDVGPGAIKYQFNGDSMEAFQNNRPADSWFKFHVYLIRSVALSLCLPFEFVWDMAGLTGPSTRMMSRQAQRTFKEFRDNLELRSMNRTAARWAAIEMEEGRVPFRPDWANFDWERPPHLSIDVGRETDANIKEMDAGTMSGKEMCDERSKDIYEVKRQIAREAQYDVELEQEFGLEPGTLRSRFKTQMQQKPVAVPV